MAHTRVREEVEKVSITRSMNDHSSMTVEVVGTNATRNIVEYANQELKQTLAALPVGATLPLKLEPIAGRANVWRATGIYPHLNDSTNTSVQVIK